MKTWKVQAVSGDTGSELFVLVEAETAEAARKEASRNLPEGYFVGQVVAAGGPPAPGMLSTIRVEPDAAEVERQNAQLQMLRQVSAEIKALNVDVAAMRAGGLMTRPTRTIASGVMLAIIVGLILNIVLAPFAVAFIAGMVRAVMPR
jgi:hypothetical protein